MTRKKEKRSFLYPTFDSFIQYYLLLSFYLVLDNCDMILPLYQTGSPGSLSTPMLRPNGCEPTNLPVACPHALL